MLKLNLITDPVFNKYKVLKDTELTGPDGNKFQAVKFKAIVQAVNQKNGNKRVYPEETIKQILSQAEEKIKHNSLYGEPTHPHTDNLERNLDTPPIESSHLWTKIWREGDYIHGEGITIPTLKGIQLANLLLFGAGIGFSVRMIGNNVQYDSSNDTYIIKPPVVFVTYDAVSNPALKEARIKEYKVADSELPKLVADRLLSCDKGFCSLVKDSQVIFEAKKELNKITKEVIKKLINDWDKKAFVL